MLRRMLVLGHAQAPRLGKKTPPGAAARRSLTPIEKNSKGRWRRDPADVVCEQPGGAGRLQQLLVRASPVRRRERVESLLAPAWSRTRTATPHGGASCISLTVSRTTSLAAPPHCVPLTVSPTVRWWEGGCRVSPSHQHGAEREQARLAAAPVGVRGVLLHERQDERHQRIAHGVGHQPQARAAGRVQVPHRVVALRAFLLQTRAPAFNAKACCSGFNQTCQHPTTGTGDRVRLHSERVSYS
jgi:hypothetical protein